MRRAGAGYPPGSAEWLCFARDALEVVEGHLQATAQFDFRLPAEDFPCPSDVGTAACGVVLRERMEANLDGQRRYLENLVKAHSSMVCSSGLPMLTGRCSFEAARSSMPSMRSET